MKTVTAAMALCVGLAGASQLAFAAEPDGLVLPPGFHASVVNDGVGAGARHIAVRANGDIYISTNARKGAPNLGIVVLHQDGDHKAATAQHFSDVNGGTAIRFYKGALYAATPTTVYRFNFSGNELIPSAAPEVIIDGIPGNGHPSKGIAFDGKGGLYLSVPGQGNICTDPNTPKGERPVGLKPCPSLTGRAGVWRFDAEKTNQKFPADGEQIATGVRDMMAVDWSKDMGGFYGVMQDRNGTARAFRGAVSDSADADSIAEEMHRMDKGANLGWPYSYWDSAQKARILAPEYGGNGTAPIQDGIAYNAPVMSFPAHSSPLDLVFYDGRMFPASYRGGAFVAFHGGAGPALAAGHHGYDVKFVPFDKAGKPGASLDFIEGFAGPNPSDKGPGTAMYRPTGAAVGPDGALYVVEDRKGRVWRISYDGKAD